MQESKLMKITGVIYTEQNKVRSLYGFRLTELKKFLTNNFDSVTLPLEAFNSLVYSKQIILENGTLINDGLTLLDGDGNDLPALLLSNNSIFSLNNSAVILARLVDRDEVFTDNYAVLNTQGATAILTLSNIVSRYKKGAPEKLYNASVKNSIIMAKKKDFFTVVDKSEIVTENNVEVVANPDVLEIINLTYAKSGFPTCNFKKEGRQVLSITPAIITQLGSVYETDGGVKIMNMTAALLATMNYTKKPNNDKIQAKIVALNYVNSTVETCDVLIGDKDSCKIASMSKKEVLVKGSFITNLDTRSAEVKSGENIKVTDEGAITKTYTNGKYDCVGFRDKNGKIRVFPSTLTSKAYIHCLDEIDLQDIYSHFNALCFKSDNLGALPEIPLEWGVLSETLGVCIFDYNKENSSCIKEASVFVREQLVIPQKIVLSRDALLAHPHLLYPVLLHEMVHAAGAQGHSQSGLYGRLASVIKMKTNIDISYNTENLKDSNFQNYSLITCPSCGEKIRYTANSIKCGKCGFSTII